jgi:class 3 adenylate cyclase
VSTPEQLADQASEALDAGGPDAHLSALRALTDAVREQTKAIAALAERFGAGGGGDAAATRAAPPKRLMKPPAPAPPSTGGDMWARLGLTEGERRRVTALFSDVSGFTAMSEKLDPEEANTIMKETMAELTAIIRKHDGYVEKFIGDAICAIFGAPISHEDEPERAARTAIEMHAALDARATRRPDLPPLLMHIGINTGLVIAGTVGDGTQFGVMGDTVNTAARLMDKAVKTQTFVSAETARRIRHQFMVTDMGQYQMKGKDLPVQAFLLERELSDAEAKQARTLMAPLIGRDEELATLRSAATRTTTGPDGAIALMLGDAGMGKTRLLDELEAELGDDMLVLRGSGHSVGARPFGLISDVLEPLIDQMTPGPDKDIAMTVLTGGETAELPELGAAIGRGLAHAAAVRPVAILVDRFEWADQASVDLAVLLMRRVGTARVMVVLASRPGAGPVEAIALVGPSWVSRLRLAPLSNERIAEMLQALLPGGVSPELAVRLATRADGNPAFAEEIALSLVDEGVIVQTEGEWTLVGDPDSVEIPSTIQELIEARIDALPDASRLVLQEASVIGNTFTADLLSATATNPETVPGALAELAVAELLRAPSDLDDDDDDEYGFKSPVVREVAYESILHRRRPAYHLRVANALIAQQSDREGLVELLAHHFLYADDPENGVKYLDLAAIRAQAAGAHRTAEQMLTRALTLAARHPGTIRDDILGDLHERRGYSRMVLDDREGAVEDLTAASNAHAAAQRNAERIEIDERLAWFLVLSHRIDEGAAHADRIRADAEAAGLTDILVRVDAVRSLVRALQGDLPAAIELATEVTERAEASADAHAKAKAAIVMGGLRRWQGDLAGARTLLEPATEATRGLTFPVLSGLASRWLLLTLVDAGDWQAVEHLAGALLVRGDEAGDIHTAATAHHSMGVMARELGDLARAEKSGETALALATQGRVRAAERVTMVLSLAANAGRRGDYAVADSRLQQAAGLISEDPWLNWRLQALLCLAQGRLALAQGNNDAALAAAARARASLGDAEARIERARAALLEAEASAAAGHPEAPEKLLGALALAREIDNPMLLADVALAAARLAPGAAPDAHGLAEGAVARIQELVPTDWKDEFAASPRVVALSELTT